VEVEVLVLPLVLGADGGSEASCSEKVSVMRTQSSEGDGAAGEEV
jgi:hypothetical protein